MTELCELAFKYGTDKCPQLGHDYTPVYWEVLKNKKYFKKILELGIGSRETMQWTPEHYQLGASLKMWRDFFPEARIYGVDSSPTCIFEDERIKTFQLNTMKANQMSWLIGEIGSDINLVIDDGGHSTGIQLRTFRNLMPLLNKDVIYIIEDSKSPEIILEELRNNYEARIIKYTLGKQDTLILVKNK